MFVTIHTIEYLFTKSIEMYNWDNDVNVVIFLSNIIGNWRIIDLRRRISNTYFVFWYSSKNSSYCWV